MERVWLLLFRGYTYRLAKNNLQASPKIACKTANVMVRSNYNKQWNIDFHMCYLANDTLICFIYALYPPYNHFTDSITFHVQKKLLTPGLTISGFGVFLILVSHGNQMTEFFQSQLKEQVTLHSSKLFVSFEIN